MTPELWQRLKPLYEEASGKPPAERARFLTEACHDDPELLKELESLLDVHDDQTGSFDAPLVSFQNMFPAKAAALNPGMLLLERFEILSSLGAGGVGEVYRAQDRRLNRIVALKVLSAQFSENAEVRKRLHREAHAISVLTHPHICTLYDIGEVDGTDFLVMELVEGETLQARLRKGPLSMEQALRYGVQIAAALGHAHRRGIVHRDLKPGNIMITKSGVKLLDFGLAKLFSPITPGPAPNGSPASTDDPLTEETSIFGTLQYMAPEQLEGRVADLRCDIFAFGAVMYEMATGKLAFAANSRAGLIAAILSSEPSSISTWQTSSPEALDRIVKQCLAKDPDTRWQSAADLATELTWISEAKPQAEIAASEKPRRPLRYVAMAVALSMAAALAGFMVALRKERQPPPQPMHLSLMPPDRASFGVLALSPEGRRLAFLSSASNETRGLWVRSLDSSSAQFFPETEDALNLFWSPDGRYIGFLTGAQLKRVPASGGAPEILCPVSHAQTGTWSRDGVVLFSPDVYQPIRSVNLRDCSVKAVTRFDLSVKDIGNNHPVFLPDNKHFLWVLNRNSLQLRHDIYVSALGSEASQLLVLNGGMPEYVAPGHLVFVRDGKLMAQDFDTRSLRLSGEAVPIVQQEVEGNFFEGSAVYSVSSTNLLVYKPEVKRISRMTWLDRAGHPAGELAETGFNRLLQLSPDGTRALVARMVADTRKEDIWIFQLDLRTWTRFTFEPSQLAEARWSPDSKQIYYFGHPSGQLAILRKAADGSGAEETILQQNHWLAAKSFTPDGRSLLFESFEPESGSDLWRMPLAGDRQPAPFIKTSSNEGNAVLSPDGRWVAYVSDKSGRFEIYVRPFPEPGPEIQISSGTADQVAGGATLPLDWRRDGKEIFYVSADWKMMSVPVIPGAAFTAGAPRPLFAVPPGSQVEATGDGRRFLVNAPEHDDKPAPVEVILNWSDELSNKR